MKDLNAFFTTEIHYHPSVTTSIAHLNVQVLMSTFNEFSFMLDEYQFDGITLSETWLKDNKTISRSMVTTVILWSNQ